ncbi:MAG: hypothetical protein M3R48_07120 [Candidatus Dormibacteraeota bacterium]|nr:hypothetical protein [Candidatus Dormibacteraeota bacterium]
MNAADLLDRALDGHDDPAVTSLVAVAREVADALRSPHLDAAERDRIYARSLALLEEAVLQNRRTWLRVLRLERRAPVILGGAAAVTIGAAAIAWALVHGRRSHPALAAGLTAGAAVPLSSR